MGRSLRRRGLPLHPPRAGPEAFRAWRQQRHKLSAFRSPLQRRHLSHVSVTLASGKARRRSGRGDDLRQGVVGWTWDAGERLERRGGTDSLPFQGREGSSRRMRREGRGGRYGGGGSHRLRPTRVRGRSAARSRHACRSEAVAAACHSERNSGDDHCAEHCHSAGPRRWFMLAAGVGASHGDVAGARDRRVTSPSPAALAPGRRLLTKAGLPPGPCGTGTAPSASRPTESTREEWDCRRTPPGRRSVASARAVDVARQYG